MLSKYHKGGSLATVRAHVTWLGTSEPPKIFSQKPKATAKVTLTSHQLKNNLMILETVKKQHRKAETV